MLITGYITASSLSVFVPRHAMYHEICCTCLFSVLQSPVGFRLHPPCQQLCKIMFSKKKNRQNAAGSQAQLSMPGHDISCNSMPGHDMLPSLHELQTPNPTRHPSPAWGQPASAGSRLEQATPNFLGFCGPTYGWCTLATRCLGLHARSTSWQLQRTLLPLASCWLHLFCGPQSGVT